MNTKYLLAVFALLTLAIATTAVIAKEKSDENAIFKPPFIWKSRGFAITDWSDYKTMKVMLFRHPLANNKIASTDVVNQITRGFLKLDETKYALRNINFFPGKNLTADVFPLPGVTASSSEVIVVGKLSLEKDTSKKPNVWIGKLVIGEEEYHVYLYAQMLKIKPIPILTEEAINSAMENVED